MSRKPRKRAEKRVISEITLDGLIPLNLCFVFDDTLVCWNPSQAGFGFYMIEDGTLYLDCLDYLRDNSDRSFTTFRELRDYAHAHNWPRLHEFDQALAGWQDRRDQGEKTC